MKVKILAVILTLVLVISCCPLVSMALPTDETVLIHQVYGGNQKGDTPFDRSFIELYNTGDEAVDLDGYVLAYQCDKKPDKQAGGTDGEEVTLALDGYSVPAHSSFLVACAEEPTTDEFLVCSIDTFDVEWDQAIYNKQYRVALYNGTDLVDAVTALDVAESEEAAGEGDPVLDISKQKAIRRVNFADTDNNAADFEIVKYEKVGLANLYNEAEYVAAYGPKSTADGEWTSTPTMAEDFIGYDFVKQGGYEGPYNSADTVELGEEGLAFDSSVANGYMTAELLPQDVGAFKYAFVTIKTSEEMEASKFALTIGNVAKSWDQWIVADTLEYTTPVTDEFQTFVLDLEENGVTESVSATGPDLAMNKDGETADEGIITISTIRFSNKADLDTPVKNFLGYDFASKLGFWGPYAGTEDMASLSYTSEGLLFDTSVADSYVTAEINPQEAAFRKYAKVTIKTSDATINSGEFSLTIGDVSKRWTDWTDGAAITEEFQTIVIDLEANGVTTLVKENGGDFALNKSTAVDDEGVLSIARIEFTNGSYELDLPSDDDEPIEPPVDEPEFIGLDFVNETGYWGPYTGSEDMAAITEEGLVFDTSVAGAYATAEIDPQELPFYKYAYVTIKVDDATKMTGGFSLTLGGVGKYWKDWTFAGGVTDVAITEEFQTLAIDLEASGLTELVNDGVDFALNASTSVADEGVVTISTIEFSDEAPEEEIEGTIVGYDFVNETGYWGPYTGTNMAEITEEGLTFNTATTDAYMTAELNPQETPFHRYAYITIKVDDATKMTGGFSLSLGDAGGKAWKDWTFADGTDGTITEEFQTFVIDLEESGATSLINPSTAPDLALNKNADIADEGIITIKSIAFKNTAPEVEPDVPTGPSDLYVSAVAPSVATVVEGEDTYFTATVRNLGEYASEGYTVSFYLKGMLIETVEVEEALEAGSTARVSTTIAKKIAFGSNTIKVFVECNNDSDDTNNTAKARFLVD